MHGEKQKILTPAIAFAACTLLVVLSSAMTAGECLNSGSITLLALTENDTEMKGTIARLELEIHLGHNRVFLETFPMTKITTQASLRFAQQIACKELEIDCTDKDFLFKIQALPGIVGGPSAGGAAALLTASLLLNKTLPEDFAMTGTINSGGIIGSVGGLKQKLEAAAGNKIKIVLIPKGTRILKENNETIDLVEFGAQRNLSVKEVGTLREVLEIALGTKLPVTNASLQIQERYKRIMRDVAVDLCDRSNALAQQIKRANITDALNFTKRGRKAFEAEAYYSSASYCFRANVLLQQAGFSEANLTIKELSDVFNKLKEETAQAKKEFSEKSVATITDLQTYMAVMERIVEVEDLLKDIEQKLAQKDGDAGNDLAYAKERLFSALTWARFFQGEDKRIVINLERLKQACVSKISEAEERYNYAKAILPEGLTRTRADIDRAYTDLNTENYIMCLYGASKAKAEADVVLSLLGVEKDFLKELISLKLEIARNALAKAQAKNVFPIIAYSYYEYSNSLREFDDFSSLLFAEYALELSDLDIYFEEPVAVKVLPKPELPKGVVGFILGFLIGILFARLALMPRKPKQGELKPRILKTKRQRKR